MSGYNRGHSAFSATQKKQNVPNVERGFILVSVIIAITLVAAIAFALSQQGASETNVTSGELEHDHLRYVAEAGIAHARLQLTKNTSCSGYTDIPKTDFGVDSYKTKFKTYEGSPVTVIATGRLESGLEYTLQSKPVRAYQSPAATVLQLGKTAGKDVHIDSFYNNNNYGGQADVTVRSDPGWIQRPLLEFDLSAIPTGVRIVSAKLELKLAVLTKPGVIGVHRLTRSWEEGTGKGTGGADGATWLEYDGANIWAQPGGELASTLYGTATAGSGKLGQWVSWEIGDLVDEWVSGQFPNYGLMLVGDGVVDNAGFQSREGLEPASAPKLTIAFACECGKTCAGGASKNLLLVVGNAGSPSSGDLDRKALIESWDYVVTLIDDGDSQANFDTAAAANDVVYIAGSASSAAVGTKLTAATVGVVSEVADLVEDLGFAAHSVVFKSRDEIDIVDNSHYITGPFAIGLVTVTSSTQPHHIFTGGVAAGFQRLADVLNTGSQWKRAMGTLASGAALYGGGTAAGRRVQLPWGGNGFDPNTLTDDGLTIMRRAIEWGARGPQENPVAHWKFDDGSGLTALDSEGGHDGTLLNGPAWVPGKLDTALDFDGSDDVVEAPQASDLDLSTFTVAAWIRISAITSSQTILEKRDGADLATVNYLLLAAGNEITWAFYDGGWASFSTSAANMDVDTWYHVAGTYDNSTGEGNVYVNGVLLASGTTTKNPPLVPGTVRIGDSECAACDDKWNGSLDDVRIYNRALSASEVADLAAGGSGPIAHWKLDDGTGLTALDSVGGHHGTLLNGPSWGTGMIDGGLSFDNSNDYVDVPHDDTLSLSSLTISAWMNRTTQNTVYDTIVLKKQQSNYWLYAYDDEIGFSFNDSGWVHFMTPAANLTIDEWYHVAVTFDDTIGEANIYVDGALSHTGTTVKRPVPNSADLFIGGDHLGGYPWPGTLDDIRLYDYAMSATQVSDLFTAGSGGGGEVTFEEFADASLSSDGLSITIPKPASTAAGDLLIAAIVTDSENKPAMTAPAGWTLIDHDKTLKQVTMDVLWKIAGASEPGSYDFSWAKSQEAYGWIMRFTGHDPTTPIHDSQSDGGTSSSPVSPAVSTTIANTMIVRIGGFDDDDITPGDPGLSGHTAVTMGASGTGTGTASGGAGYVLQSGTGDSGTSNFSLTASEEYRAVTIAIAPAP